MIRNGYRCKRVRLATEKIFDNLKEMGIEKIDLPYEFYWEIPREKKYDSYEEPQNFLMGQLSDDLLEIRKIATDKSEPLPYALNWLASVFMAMSQEIPYKVVKNENKMH